MIYVITVFEKMGLRSINFASSEKIPNPGSIVNVGWYPILEKAREVLEYNMTDLWETCYNYGVIEMVPQGMYNFYKKKIYFKYNRELDKYEEMNIEDVPKEFLTEGFNFCRVGE